MMISLILGWRYFPQKAVVRSHDLAEHDHVLHTDWRVADLELRSASLHFDDDDR